MNALARTEERSTERALIGEYRDAIQTVLQGLNAERLPLALESARLPENVRVARRWVSCPAD